MGVFRSFVLHAALVGALLAETTSTSSQMVDFVRKSAKTSPDKTVADYLKNIMLSDRLSDDAVESCIQSGIGPGTRAALMVLLEQSSKLPDATSRPAAVAVAAVPVGPAPPSEDEKARVIQKVTEYARGYIKNLPNFTCTQVTKRFADPSLTARYQLMDTVMENLSYSESHESYKVVSVNNTPTTKSHDELGGSTSSGEFGTDLAVLFDRQTHTEFKWDSWTTWGGRRTHRFAYEVRQENSEWTIEYERKERTTAGYKGFIYVDRDVNMIMRITREAVGIPAEFPVQNVKQDTRYTFQRIGESDREYLVPASSQLSSRMGRELRKNETEFRLYRKFGTESVIKFDTVDEPKKQD